MLGSLLLLLLCRTRLLLSSLALLRLLLGLLSSLTLLLLLLLGSLALLLLLLGLLSSLALLLLLLGSLAPLLLLLGLLGSLALLLLLLLLSSLALLLLLLLLRSLLLRPAQQLAIHGFTRLVTVMPVLQLALLIGTRITIARILPLVHRQRRTGLRPRAVPAIPIAVVLLPAATPMLTPARRLPAVPLLKIDGWPPVVENRHAQHEIRHESGLDHIPRAVVPGTRVPIILGVNPI